MEVLRLLAQGMSNREMAERLYVSEGTIKTHVHNLIGKLDAQSRTHAAARARELGFV
jgi:DNA-binding NarL/FixJ family response regulator